MMNYSGTLPENDWLFSIEKAETIFRLPKGVSILDKAAYTGLAGEKGSGFIIDVQGPDLIKFSTTKVLQPGEGLTVAVSWPKGFIIEPVFKDKVHYFFQDYPSFIAGLLGTFVLLVFYLVTWSKVGKDPEKGTIYPLFEPPKDFSPAAVRYVSKMGYNDKVIVASLVSMAVKGYIQIHESRGEFSISRTQVSDSALSKSEKKIANVLFSRSNRVEFGKTNHTTIRNAIESLKRSLKADFDKIYFLTNSRYRFPGYVISVLTMLASILFVPETVGALFIMLWLSVWTSGCYALTVAVIRAWKSAMHSASGWRILQKGGAIGMTLFSLPFLLGEIFGFYVFWHFASPIILVILMTILFINILFYQLLKAPTIHGRRFLDQVEGFKMYLEVAEEDRLNLLHSPEKTSALFEKYLPYAIALDVENKWSEKFADVLEKAGQAEQYSPSWYSGSHWSSIGSTGFASSLGSSFSSAISSSSTAPGSSSGSGGGGSSGGGGW